jgi:4'-phosphopantetheinyl transferase
MRGDEWQRARSWGSATAAVIGDVQIWYQTVDDFASPKWAQYESLLCPNERDRAARFVRLSDRRHYAAAHALLRVMLSSYARIPPREWRFRVGPQGRPEIESGLSTLPLRFSLSHTDRLVAVAVTLDRAVGLDVEAFGRSLDDMSGVIRFFAPSEIRFLEGCPSERRARAFIAIWTMKEAFVKATGLGLSLPLDQFAVGLDPPRLVAPPVEWGPAQVWQFFVSEPSPGHQLAVVARAEPSTMLRFTVSRTSCSTLMPEPDPRRADE